VGFCAGPVEVEVLHGLFVIGSEPLESEFLVHVWVLQLEPEIRKKENNKHE
jgi:hypothetical protein